VVVNFIIFVAANTTTTTLIILTINHSRLIFVALWLTILFLNVIFLGFELWVQLTEIVTSL
jgi:hypothetical protein